VRLKDLVALPVSRKAANALFKARRRPCWVGVNENAGALQLNSLSEDVRGNQQSNAARVPRVVGRRVSPECTQHLIASPATGSGVHTTSSDQHHAGLTVHA
jgi:hypothetical protein